MSDIGKFLGSIVLGVSVISLIYMHDCSVEEGKEAMRKEAIEQGVACYYCYPKTAQCSFLWGKNWKQCETPEEK